VGAIQHASTIFDTSREKNIFGKEIKTYGKLTHNKKEYNEIFVAYGIEFYKRQLKHQFFNNKKEEKKSYYTKVQWNYQRYQCSRKYFPRQKKYNTGRLLYRHAWAPRGKHPAYLIGNCNRCQIHNFSKLDGRWPGAQHGHMMREDTQRGAGQAVLPRPRVLYGQLQVTAQDKTHQVLGFSAHKTQSKSLKKDIW
jgi:hypothetical protein